MKRIQITQGVDPLELLKLCGGYYERRGNGPLVGYAARDGEGKQLVGMVYANFAKAERHGTVLAHIAESIAMRFPDILRDDSCFCAAPEGGKALAVALAVASGKNYIFCEKEVIALKSVTSREQSCLVWGRHEPEVGERVWIVEDVCNNFSTTADMIALIERAGAKVVGIVCFLNRSLTVEGKYSPMPGVSLPVLALVRKPIAEYHQDDPAVASDVAAGNVVFKPKNDWARLVAASAT